MRRTRDVKFYTVEEVGELAEKNRRAFIKKALAGNARWGAWRYNPRNLTLEIDSSLSGSPKNNPYYVDLEQCNTSAEILDCLCQLLGKNWCPPEQVGYLLQAIDELADILQSKVCSGGEDKRFDMGKHLRNMAKELQ